MEERTWTRLSKGTESKGTESKGAESKGTESTRSSMPLCIWDGGNEQWELYENGELRHYRILHRELIDSDRMREIVERLEESAIPAEIFGKHTRASLQWTLEKKQVHVDIVASNAVWELIPLSDWIPANALFQTNAIRQ